MDKISRNAPFKRIGSVRPKRSAFNLSHTKIFTCDMGQLIPVLCEDCIPGDHFKIGNQIVIRFQPLTKPTMHEINVYTHYFFVPDRLMDDNFEDFYLLGVTGDYEGTLQQWSNEAYTPQKYTIWDYLGFGGIGINIPQADLPNAFPKIAYNFVFNTFYRDENYIEPVDLMQNNILNCAWEKDYFTSSQPEQQRGTSPSFDIKGLVPLLPYDQNGNVSPAGVKGIYGQVAAIQGNQYNTGIISPIYVNNDGTPTTAKNTQLMGTMENTVTFNMNDLRIRQQLQLWLERNQRGGVRFTEGIQAHFGISPRDERLDRPEYIGGTKSSVIISEVLQTSNNENDISPQGNLAGHGISVSGNIAGSYTVKEPGVLIGLMSVRPRTNYSQGIDRMWLKKTAFDYYFPEFAHLSEQGIKKMELYVSSDTTQNNKILSFIPKYDEYRYRRNMICADMRDYFENWHMSRKLPSNVEINSDFITMNPTKRIFEVQNEPGLVVNFGNSILAIRPMPVSGEPGLLDHTYGGI